VCIFCNFPLPRSSLILLAGIPAMPTEQKFRSGFALQFAAAAYFIGHITTVLLLLPRFIGTTSLVRRIDGPLTLISILACRGLSMVSFTGA